MSVLRDPILAYYLLALGMLCVYGTHRSWLVWAFLRSRSRPPPPAPPPGHGPRGPVTVQLPIYNEPNVARRVIEAACAMEPPPGGMEVQVLDDSDDGSAPHNAALCQRLRELGHDVQHLHRPRRRGYKAGALAAGLERARGELVAVFDADFVPPRDFLRRTVPHFADPSIGMVQARWTHLNRGQSLLTRIQAVALDAHFVLEQQARAASGRWFNFNGTAGVWRRRCIDDAGGWHSDTLTEDTDLSYRAQLAGWRFRYLSDLECPAELPPTVSALVSQQHRWTKGLIQTAIKLLPRILRSGAPGPVKLEAFFHLTAPAPYAFVLLLALLAAPGLAVALPAGGAATAALALGASCLLLGTLSACAFYVVAARALGARLWPTVALLPALLAVGVGVSVTNTAAALGAVFGPRGTFVRTPKFAGAPRSSADPAVARRRLPRGIPEVGLGLLLAACVPLALLRTHTLVGVPFLALFATGFLAIGLPRMVAPQGA
jgi:hypothetical protein